MRYFYREPAIINNDFSNTEVPLQINCAGESIYDIKLHATAVRSDYYLFYLYSGEVTILSKTTNKNKLTDGEFIIYNKNHTFDYKNEGGEKMVYYWVHFTGNDTEKIFEQLNIKVDTVYKAGPPEKIKLRYEDIFTSFSIRDDFFGIDSAQSLVSLLVTLARCINGANEDKKLEKQRISASLKYIQNNFTQPITVQSLADMEFMSVSRYRTVFRSATGMPPQEYIISLRINLARELLDHTYKSINDISLIVGWQDQRYFSRIFKQRLGISPTEYRSVTH